MKRLMFEVDYGPERQFCAIRRGLLDGCELLLSKRDRLPMQTGIFEHEISARFSEFAGQANVFVDVGAAEGWFSIYMLRNTEAKVFAFEAAKDFSDVLLQNLERNAGGDQVVVYSDSALTGGSRSPETIDSIIGTQEGAILLKVDVDGDEIEVLEGAHSVLESPDARVMIKVHDESTESRCLRLLSEYGFHVEIVGPAWWRRAIVRDCRGEPARHWLIAEKPTLGGFHF